jgi:alpha-beta hydrolase superfamily lysophospholipase
MCKILDSVKPPWPLPELLNFFKALAPTWPVVLAKDHRKLSFRLPEKLELANRNPRRYTGKPRLGTAAEMLRVTELIGKRLADVSIPFIVFHGEDDVVTDPEVSKELYAKARSKDKTLKLYRGMWHALLAGEPDENVETIYRDIEDWLKERVAKKRDGEGGGGGGGGGLAPKLV